MMKFLLCAILSTTVRAADFPSAVLADNPLACYRLNENPITGATRATDASGNGRNLAYIGSPAGGGRGMSPGDSGVTFSSAGGQFLQASAGGAFATFGPAIDAGLSLEFVLKTKLQSGADRYLFSAFQDGLKTTISLQLRANGDPLGPGDIRLFLRDEHGNDRAFFVTAAPALFDGHYHHLVVTFKGESKVYLDTVPIPVATASTKPGELADFANFTDNPVRIGAGIRADPATKFFEGGIAEAAFYTHALTPGRVAAHYAAIAAEAAPPPVGPEFPLPATDSFLAVSETPTAGSFLLTGTPVHYSAGDAKVVEFTAKALAGDMEMVTGAKSAVSSSAPAGNAILAGTLGHSELIDSLIRTGKLDASKISGKWESYLANIVENPFPGVARALVIAGSDRRGTAYGMTALSEAIGVSPWVWWADVVPQVRPHVYVSPGLHIEPTPGVKYRGIFINDEDWGMLPWASKTYADTPGKIGPQAYARIFQLMTRLRANYCWPAMHRATQAFDIDPQNKVVADEHAIVMGSSHHEPMLRNTSEYDPKVRGPYNYWTNRSEVFKFWETRVKETAEYENIYTVGMRGLDDDGMLAPAGTSIGEKAEMIQNEIIPDQRKMLAKHFSRDPADVPQTFVPYKEALLQYRSGLKLPDDVTLVWPDDNHGYIRQLSTLREQRRSGGSGVYYHLSYWGAPEDYLWLCTTPPVLVREEMTKAWDYDAKRVWIVNVGDLKPGEIGMEFFLDLAHDPEKYRNFDQRVWLQGWATRTFGPARGDAIGDVLNEHYRLNQMVRPEHLNVNDSHISAVDRGDESQRRVDAFKALADAADKIYGLIPLPQRSAYYQLVLYPVRASAAQNVKILQAERSRLYAAQGRMSTNAIALEAQGAYQTVKNETAYYNLAMSGGKWQRMMWDHPRNLQVFGPPAVGKVDPPAGGTFGIAVEGDESTVPAGGSAPLPPFTPGGPAHRFIDVFATGATPAGWTATASEPWIVLSRTKGSTTEDCRLLVSIDGNKAPFGNALKGTIAITAGGVTRRADVHLTNPSGLPAPAVPVSMVDAGGIIRVEAENFTRSTGANGAAWQKIDELGLSGAAMLALPFTAPGADVNHFMGSVPSLEYDCYSYGSGPATISMHCLPTQRIHEGRGVRYAIAIGDEKPQIVDLQTDEYSAAWSANILRNAAVGVTRHVIPAAGPLTVKVWMIDPGVALDFLTVVPLNGRRDFEVENLKVAASSGDVHRSYVEGNASAGAAAALEADAAGDYVIYEAPGIEGRSYEMTVRVKRKDNRGKVRLAIADSAAGRYVSVGPEMDLFGPEGYVELPPISIAFTTAGTKYFRFTVTGKNPSNKTADYWLALDRIRLKPVKNAGGRR